MMLIYIKPQKEMVQIEQQQNVIFFIYESPHFHLLFKEKPFYSP